MNTQNELGYVYIAEASNEGYNTVQNQKVFNENGIFYVTFESVLQSFNVINRNQRRYIASNIMERFKDEKIQSDLAHNALFGELDHPMQKIKDQPLTPQRIQSIDYDRRCVIIQNPRLNGNLLEATITTTPGAKGPDLAKDIVGIGYKPMFSCRAIASLQMIDNKPTVIVRRLITYDVVQYGSHREADMISKPKAVVKNINVVKESTEEDNISSDDVMIPLKEILEHVGKTDVNAQMIMESFEIPLDNIMGFDKNRQHLIIRDKNNMIYANINPRTKKTIDDFFASF